MTFETKYTYERNLAKGEYTCKHRNYPPTTGKTKSTARSKMLRQIRQATGVKPQTNSVYKGA
jgi:hypothetical protein